MEEELTDEELRKITRRKKEEIRQEEWTPGKVKDQVHRVLREKRERRGRAPGRLKDKNRRELPKGKFTPIEDEITEAFYKQSWGANQAKVFWYVIRKTWGWQKRSGFIRVTQCAKELGIPKSRVSEALSSLVKRGIVTVNRNKTYAIQMDVGLWKNLYKSKNRT